MAEHFEEYFIELRRRAEARMGSVSVTLEKAPQAIRSLVHELSLYQIELEMQYEVLQRLQEQVEESRDLYADLYNSVPVGYFTILKDGTIVEVNQAGAALVGMQPSDLMERRIQLIVARKNREAFTNFCHGVVDTQEPRSCEVQFTHGEWGANPVGPCLTVLINAEPVRVGLGKNRYLRLAATDISERKHMENDRGAVKPSWPRRSALVRQAAGSGTLLPKSCFELLRIFGLVPATGKPSHQDFLHIIHSEDQARILDAFDRSVRAGTNCEAKYRIVRTDGSVRVVKSLGHPVFDKSGTLVNTSAR